MPKKQQTGWSVRTLARLLGIPETTAGYWLKSGLVSVMGRGRGGHTIGLAGLREMVAVMELRNAGISLQAVQLAVERRVTTPTQSSGYRKLMLTTQGIIFL